METLPIYISIAFILITIATVYFFFKASGKSTATLIILIAWLLLQAVVGLTGFYKQTSSVPPRFALLIIPPVITIILLFLLPAGRRYIDRFNIKTLTLLHIIRIPVELVLLALFLHKFVPQVMTFEGRNFDILSGLSAPVIYYFSFIPNKPSKKLLLVWNIICLGLLLNVVIYAVLSAPFTFQQFGFEQPNIALLYFPFIWLPCCVVPLVLFSHLIAIRKIVRANG